MKKNILLPLFVVVIIAGLFIPFDKGQTVEIKYPFTIVFNQLKAAGWLRWQPDVVAAKKNSDAVLSTSTASDFHIKTSKVSIDAITRDGFSYNVVKTTGKKATRYSYVILPQKIAGYSTILVTRKTNFFKLLTQAGTGAEDIVYLKAYMDNTKAFYGFSIKRGKVLDSNIVVRRSVVSIKEKLPTIIKTQFLLNEYVKVHGLTPVQAVMTDIRNISKDSVLVMIGVPVKEEPKTGDGFTYMHQPRNGNMLFASFNGKYGDRAEFYAALKTYFADHALSAPELPYEKFLDNKIPLSDTSTVKMQVCYPIF